MADDSTDAADLSRLRATAHPVRLRIMSLLTAEAMSAADVARALDITHASTCSTRPPTSCTPRHSLQARPTRSTSARPPRRSP